FVGACRVAHSATGVRSGSRGTGDGRFRPGVSTARRRGAAVCTLPITQEITRAVSDICERYGAAVIAAVTARPTNQTGRTVRRPVGTAPFADRRWRPAATRIRSQSGFHLVAW